MRIERDRIGRILTLERLPVEPVPDVEYIPIGIRSFGKGLFHYEPRLGSELGSLRFFELLPGRLVVSNIKGWEGAIALSSAADAGCIASNRFLIYRARDPERVDEPYLLYYLLSEPGLRLIGRASPGSADRNRTLAIDRFEALEIPLPPIEQQRRVVARLRAVTGMTGLLHGGRKASVQLREALTASLLDRLFADIDAVHQPLGSIADVRGGIQKSPSRAAAGHPVRYLTVAHVGRDSISLDDPRYFEVPPEELEARRLEAGDVLVIEGNGSSEQIGRAALYRGEIDPCVHQNHVIRVRTHPDTVEPAFLTAFLNSPPGRRSVQAQARTSSGLRTLSVGRIKRIEVPVPLMATQQAVVERAEWLMLNCRRLQGYQERAAQLLDALLPAVLNEAFVGLE